MLFTILGESTTSVANCLSNNVQAYQLFTKHHSLIILHPTDMVDFPCRNDVPQDLEIQNRIEVK